jgi:hypothetical protein
VRFAPNGARLLGYGDGRVSVNGVDVCRGGKPVPIDSVHAVCQWMPDGVSHLALLDLGSGAVMDLMRQEVSYVRAGGGIWGVTVTPGYAFTSTGWREDGAYILDVGPDGRLYVTSYAEQRDIRVYRVENGQHVYETSYEAPRGFYGDSSGDQFRALAGGRFAYVDGAAQLVTVGFNSLPASEPIYGVVPVECAGSVYVLELRATRLTLRRAVSPDGWMVQDAPGTYGPDAIATVGAQILCGWAVSPAEMPHDGRQAIIDISTPPVSLAPPVAIPDFQPQPHASVAVFGGPDGRIIGVDEPVTPEARYVFVTLGRDNVTAAAEFARTHGLILAAYLDGPDYPPSWVPSFLDVRIQAWVQCYPQIGEPSIVTIQKRQATIAALRSAGVEVGLVLAAYRQTHATTPSTYSWALPDVLDLLGGIAALGALYDVAAYAAFTQTRGTDDGIAHSPEIAEAIRRLQAACAGEPVATPHEPRPTPAPTPAPVPPPTPVPTPAPIPVARPFFERARPLI